MIKKIFTGICALAVSVFAAFTAFAEDAAAAAPTAAPENPAANGFLAKNGDWITIVVYIILLGALFYFLIIRPQKKRQKEEEELKSSLCLGQKVTSIGGIVGTIVSIKDDEITVQTSIDNTLMTFKSWAIKEVQKPVSDEK